MFTYSITFSKSSLKRNYTHGIYFSLMLLLKKIIANTKIYTVGSRPNIKNFSAIEIMKSYK